MWGRLGDDDVVGHTGRADVDACRLTPASLSGQAEHTAATPGMSHRLNHLVHEQRLLPANARRVLRPASRQNKLHHSVHVLGLTAERRLRTMPVTSQTQRS